MAGLRTNALVALGSCGFVVFSAMVGTFAGGGYWAPSLVAAGFVIVTKLLHALSQASLGLRRMDSADIPDTAKVIITAQAIATKRNDAALEQIVGRLSLEPQITAATWQVDQEIAEA